MTVLGRSEIKKRLQGHGGCPPQIFEEDSWDKDCLRGAAYDLRVACDLLITPEGTRYWDKGKPGYTERSASFTIEPGEVAFVSTVEELCMPPDLVGNIAPRFRRALEGILVMGGMLVDPSYRGRLHFQLANIGKESFVVRPGRTSVAAIQFLPVIGKTKGRPAPKSDTLLDELFHEEAKEPLPQLAFFSNVGELKGKVKAVETDLDDQKVAWSTTKQSTDQLLVFGVFLVVVTLFTVAVAALVNALAGGSFEDATETVKNVDFTLPGIVVSVALLLVVGLACALMMRPVLWIVRRKDDESKRVAAAKSAEAAKDLEHPPG